MADGYSNLPDFDSLPIVEGMPQGCAWGLFDHDGQKDRMGCLNLLTPSVVKAAATEVREGVSISLNWPMDATPTPGFGRKGLLHKVMSFKDSAWPLHGFDDELEFNTQCSSQWDSLCHFAHQTSALNYNGVTTEVKDLVQPRFSGSKEDMTKAKTLPTLERWHERGGLVGRGVLLDYKAWADAHGVQFSPFESHKITTTALEQVAAWEGVTLKQADILLIRSGFTEALEAAVSEEEQAEMLGTGKTVGVEGTTDVAKWFWNHHFAAVAGDMPSFEVIPPAKDGVEGAGLISELVLHSYFLSLFGLVIGELFDLKTLSAHCANTKRYSFMLTSIPLNVSGSVGSPPNALAIF